MKKNKLTAAEKRIKITEQKYTMAIILSNVLDTPEVSDSVKSAICSSLINLTENSFIPGDDDGLLELINKSIDIHCEEMEIKHGIEDYRETLNQSIRAARKMVDEMKDKIRRIKEGNDILKGICLN